MRIGLVPTHYTWALYLALLDVQLPANGFERYNEVGGGLGVLGLRPHRGTSEGTGGGDGSEKLVALLLKTRQDARAARQFALADRVRDGLAALGYEIQDRPGGKSDARKKNYWR